MSRNPANAYRDDFGPKCTDRFRDLNHVTVDFFYPGTVHAMWKELDRQIYYSRGGTAIMLSVIRRRDKMAAPFGEPWVVLTKWRKHAGLWSRLSMLTLNGPSIAAFRSFLDRTFQFETVPMCPRCGWTEHDELPNGKKRCRNQHCALEWPRDEKKSSDEP